MTDLKIDHLELLEELTDKQKEYVDNMKMSNRVNRDLPAVPREVHDEFFKHYTGDEKADKIIIPLKLTPDYSHTNPLNKPIAKHLYENGGWTIHDYHQGIATRKLTTKKGFVKPEFKSIGSILQETGGNEKNGRFYDLNGDVVNKPLLKGFNEDPHRAGSKTNEYQIVISRHPHDVAGMSTDRGWQSCMTLPNFYEDGTRDDGGCNHHYIASDLKHKTMVAYLTHKGDDNIRKPVSRIAIKRFSNNHGHDIWRPEEGSYGVEMPEFNRRVTSLLSAHYPTEKDTKYSKNPELYNDTGMNWTAEHDESDSPIEKIYRNHGSNTKIVHTHENEQGFLDSKDDNPSLEYHVPTKGGHYEYKEWHKNGVLHRETGPARIGTFRHTNGKEYPYLEEHFQNGVEHSPKDGKTPSTIKYDYDYDTMEPTYHLRNFAKFGEDHNSIIHGFATSEYKRNHDSSEMTITTRKYGMEHSENGVPSSTTFMQYDNGSSAMHKGWRTPDYSKNMTIHYNTQNEPIKKSVSLTSGSDKYVDTHTNYSWLKNKNGTYSGDYSVVTNPGRPAGTAKHTKLIKYENETTPHEGNSEPANGNIIEKSYRRHGMFGGTSYVYSGSDLEPVHYRKHEDGNVSEIYYDSNNSLHRVGGPAQKTYQYDHDGKLTQHYEYSRIHGQINVNHHNDGVLDHEWNYNHGVKNGFLKKVHGDEIHNISYRGELTTNPSLEQVHERRVTDHAGMPVDPADGSPQFFNKNDVAIRYQKQPKGKPRSIYSDGTNYSYRRAKEDGNLEINSQDLGDGKFMDMEIPNHEHREVKLRGYRYNEGGQEHTGDVSINYTDDNMSKPAFISIHHNDKLEMYSPTNEHHNKILAGYGLNHKMIEKADYTDYYHKVNHEDIYKYLEE